MNDDTRRETLATADETVETPRIVEEEVSEAGDKPNTCRFCAGSSFC